MDGIKFRSRLSLVEERQLFATWKRSARPFLRALLRLRKNSRKKAKAHARDPVGLFQGTKSESAVNQAASLAQARIIADHLPLVEELARKLFRKNKAYVVDIDDLRSAGEEGLVVAIHRFRGARRTRFATYAAWWVMEAMLQTIRNQRWIIGIHDGFGNLLAKLPLRERAVIVARFGLDGRGERTLEDVGQHLSITKQAVASIEEKALNRLRATMVVRPRPVKG